MEKENNVVKENDEIKEVVNGNTTKEGSTSTAKTVINTILQQLVLVAAACLGTVLTDLILKLAGYKFVEGEGIEFMAAMVIYFIFNCIYLSFAENKKNKKALQK